MYGLLQLWCLVAGYVSDSGDLVFLNCFMYLLRTSVAAFSVTAVFVELTVLLPYSFIVTSAKIQAKSALLHKQSGQKDVKATPSHKTEGKRYEDDELLSPSRADDVDSKGRIYQLVIDSVEKKDA